MKKNQLEVLAHIVLPSEIVDHFEITSDTLTKSGKNYHTEKRSNYFPLSEKFERYLKSYLECYQASGFQKISSIWLWMLL